MCRNKKMIILSHCILNVNAKVVGFNPYPAMMKELVDLIHDKGYGIIQLPCPETLLLGIRRWGVVKEQLSHEYAREAMAQMLKPTLYQVETYLQSGYQIPFIIGIDGSPSCGVQFTCRSDKWRGEMSTLEDLQGILEDVSMVSEKGVFMEVLTQELQKLGFTIPMLSIDEENPLSSLETVKKDLESTL